jgi:hypothetical protein
MPVELLREERSEAVRRDNTEKAVMLFGLMEAGDILMYSNPLP